MVGPSGLEKRQPRAIVGFLPLVRQKFDRPQLPLYRRVEIADLGVRGGERIHNNWIFPLRRLAGAGCQFDRGLAVAELRYWTRGHDQRDGVVRPRVAGLEPYGLGELTLTAS